MEAASANGTTRHGVAHSFSLHAACGDWRPHVFAPHGPEHNGSRRRGATRRMTCEGQPSPSSKLIPVGRISQVGRGRMVSRWVCDTDMALMRRQRCKGTKQQTVLQTERHLRPTQQQHRQQQQGICSPTEKGICSPTTKFSAELQML